MKIIDFGCATEISDSESVVKQVFGNPECAGMFPFTSARITYNALTHRDSSTDFKVRTARGFFPQTCNVQPL